MLSSLIVLTGCERYELFVPEYRHFVPPVEEVTMEQLLYDYTEDEVAADAKYEDKRFLYTGVEVEELNVIIFDPASSPNIDIINNSIEFRPKYNIGTALVSEGFVVDIVGEVQSVIGAVNSYLIVEDCWISIVEGITLTGTTDWGY